MQVETCFGKVEGAYSRGAGLPAKTLVERIAKAYRVAEACYRPPNSALWSVIAERSREVHQALMANDLGRLSVLLGNPGAHELFYGFDNLFKSDIDAMRIQENVRSSRIEYDATLLATLGIATGTLRAINPEFGGNNSLDRNGLENMLAGTERHLGGPIDFPNPFPDEHGLVTSRGIISFRAIQALYQAWRVKKLSVIFGGSVLEIGAGLGRTAYYAYRCGVADYTLLDLPITNVAQATFLGMTLGSDKISLNGEERLPGSLRIGTPDYLQRGTQRFNVAINVDSLTEINESVATDYAAYIAEHADVFLSINHEANPYMVRQLKPFQDRCVARSPYWLRPGYVEELFVFRRG